jgi:Zn-dependent protease
MLFDGLNDPLLLLYWFLIFAFSISFHEMSHALSANLLGDPTAKNAGRVTLDPLKHLDLFGTIMILISFIGWAKPVPVNPSKFKNPKFGYMIVSLAGPLSNMILAFVFTFIYLLFYVNGDLGSETVRQFFLTVGEYGLAMNISLAIFNLLPIPPLDGSKILSGILPTKYYFKFMQNQQIFFALIIVLMFTGMFSRILNPIRDWVTQGLFFIIMPLAQLF